MLRSLLDWPVRSVAPKPYRRTAALLVIEQPAMHAALVTDLSRLGWHCVSGPTMDAVIRRLAEPTLRIVTAVVDARTTYARSLLGYLAREHDTIRRVMLVDDAAFGDDVASQLVEAVLTSTWQRSSLVCAVGLARRR
jgi:hypothetical protein